MKPPQHSIDALPTYIAPNDPAWDFERLSSEPFRDDGHPWQQYYAGETRYDLDAPVRWTEVRACPCNGPDSACEKCGGSGREEVRRTNAIREYLREGEHPLEFVLRRLGVPEWSRAKSMFARNLRTDDDDFGELSFFCVRNGICKIQRGAEVIYDWGDSRRPVPETIIRAMVDMLPDHNLVDEVGTAIYRASQEPTEAEKKAFGFGLR
jgi:hypothetical protein